ncbi:hypothetical protein J4437_02560 [Candidatus Woesearchaeota archaeon]|nr:hypothetical protein [Candidatus Woesearchaeota archaeon]
MVDIIEEKPQYVLNQSMMRALLPKLFSLLVLSLIFYGGILLNLELLSLSSDIVSSIKLISIIVLVFLVFFWFFLSWRQARASYLFFNNRISFRNKTINYVNILSSSSSQNILDKLFKTYSLNLGNGFVVKHISQEQQIESYVNQMIQFNRR